MESRKIVLMILLAGHQRRHRHFGHSQGKREWDDMRELHRNIYITICKIASWGEFDVGHKKPKASAL